MVCLDAAWRLLLLHWRDPVTREPQWEPPGGGIEPGETPLRAARRELTEETGLAGAAVEVRWVPVHRDLVWNGTRYLGPEHFFLARFSTHRPPVSPRGLLPDEQANFQASAWLTWPEIAALPEPVEPPSLLDVLRALAPEGPWDGQR